MLHGDDDQVVPYADSAPLTAALLKNGRLKTSAGYPHGLPTTHADVVNKDILDFIRGEEVGEPGHAAPAVVMDPLPA